MIIKKLKAIQKRLGVKDGEFAATFPVHTMSWSRLKNGRSPVGIEFMRKAIRAYPEIIEAVLQELYGDNYLEVVWPLIKQIIAEQLEEETREQAAAG